MQGVVNALLNTIFVSIPEELFITLMTLIFIKRFDLLDIRMWRYNFKWVMIPVLTISIMINLFRYIIIIPRLIMMVVVLLIFYYLIIYIVKKNSYIFSKKDYRTILVGLSLSFIIWGILEGITCPLILFLIGKPLSFFNNNILWNFILSIPSRIFAFMIITYIIIKHNEAIKIKLFDVISKNNFLLISVVSFAILSNMIAFYIIKLIAINRILENYISIFQQAIIIVMVLIIPAIILFYICLLINYIVLKEKQIQQTYQNLVDQDDVMFDVDN